MAFLTPRARRVVWCAAWAGLAWVVLFWRLGAPTFWDPDEAHYAVTTRELLASGDWLAPTYNGAPFFDKPILFHQLQAVTMLAVGRTELGARLVSAVAALGLIGVTWWLAAALCGRDTAAVAALLLTVSPGVVGLTRYSILDMLFTAFLFGGVSVLAVSALRSRPRIQWVGYLLLALAVLTKGPVALVLVGLTSLVSLSLAATIRRRLFALHWVAGAALAVALSAPWFVYMYGRFGDEFVPGYLLNENVRLFARSPFQYQPGWTFYLEIVAVGTLPWTPVLIGRLYDACAAAVAGRERDGLETLLWCWIATILGFFTVSQFKLDHYIFPVTPALYLLCARAWKDAQGPPNAPHRGVRVGFRLIGPLFIVGGIAFGGAIVRFALPAVA